MQDVGVHRLVRDLRVGDVEAPRQLGPVIFEDQVEHVLIEIELFENAARLEFLDARRDVGGGIFGHVDQHDARIEVVLSGIENAGLGADIAPQHVELADRIAHTGHRPSLHVLLEQFFDGRDRKGIAVEIDGALDAGRQDGVDQQARVHHRMQAVIDRQVAADFVEAGVLREFVVIDRDPELLAQVLEIGHPLGLQPIVQQVEHQIAPRGAEADRTRHGKGRRPEIVVKGQNDMDRAGDRDFGALPRVSSGSYHKVGRGQAGARNSLAGVGMGRYHPCRDR